MYLREICDNSAAFILKSVSLFYVGIWVDIGLMAYVKFVPCHHCTTSPQVEDVAVDLVRSAVWGSGETNEVNERC